MKSPTPPESDSLPLTDFRALDAVCDRFEQHWKRALEQGAPPPLVADYRDQLPSAVREALERELVLIDQDYRERFADTPRLAGPVDATIDQPLDRTFSTWPGLPATEDATFDLVARLVADPACGPVPTEPATVDLGTPDGSATVSLGPESGSAGTDPDATMDGPARDDGATVSLAVNDATVEFQTPAPSPTPTAPARAKVKYPNVPRYRILGVLGRGGMGIVYKAEQVGLDRLVALKMIISGAHARDEELDRFRSEGRAVARLKHPNIVEIHEVGEHEGLPFFTLEFVEGGTLSEKVRERPLPPREAAGLVETISRAIGFAHEARIIHRDLKPANILLTKGGQPKITDFGLAKRLEDNSGQTHTGAVMGTPSYMAPEQAWGRTAEIGPAADQYALGAILYDLLTARPPFQGVTTLETLDLVRHAEPVPPAQLQPKIPRDLETICLKALQKEPGRRYASADALADDLRRFLNNEPIEARPVSQAERFWRWSRRNPVVASLGAAVATLLLSVATVSSVMSYRLNASIVNERAARKVADLKTEEAASNFLLAEEELDLSLDVLRGMLFQVQDQLRRRPELLPIRQKVIQSVMHDLDKVKASFLRKPLVGRTDAATSVQLGQIYLMQGRVKDALAIYERAYETLQAESRAHPNDATAARNLAAISNARADAKVRLGQDASGRDDYEAALKLRRQWAEQTPERSEPRRAIAESLSLLGKFDLMHGAPARAGEEYHEALQEYKTQPEGVLATNEGRRHLASLDERLAQVRLRLGDPKGAEELLRGALRQRSAILQGMGQAPDRELVVNDVALSQLNLGDFYLTETRDPSKAWNAYERSLRNYRSLVKSNPEGYDARRNLAAILYRAGVTSAGLKASGKAAPPNIPPPEPAGRYFEECLAIRESLAAIDPADTQARIEHMLALGRAGKPEAAAPIAEALAKEGANDARLLFQAACGFAVASSVTPKELDEGKRLRERAFETLEALIRAGWKDRVTLTIEPDLEPIRDDPRFAAIVGSLPGEKT